MAKEEAEDQRDSRSILRDSRSFWVALKQAQESLKMLGNWQKKKKMVREGPRTYWVDED